MTIRLILISVVIFLLFGCAAMLEPPSDIQRSVDWLRSDIQNLIKQQEELTKKINDLVAKNVSKQVEERRVILENINIDDSSNLSSQTASSYENGIQLMKDRNYEEAILNFAKFIKEYPQSDLADNAQYWIGECFYSEKKYKEAKETFEGVAEHFPFGNKVPDALFKIALCEGNLGNNKERVEILKEIIENYPLSDAAEKADKLLKEIESSSK